MDLHEFLENHGTILFRGYWRGKEGDEYKKRKGIQSPKPLKEMEKVSSLLGALNQDIVLVDYDDNESFEKRLEIAQEKGECCVVIRSNSKGGHFFWKDPNHKVGKSNGGNRTLLSFYPVDYKLGYKSVASRDGEIRQSESYACLSKSDGTYRKLEHFKLNKQGDLDEIPVYDLRVQAPDKYHFLNMNDGDGRNDLLHSYMMPVKTSGFSYDEFSRAATIINDSLFKDKIPEDEFETVTRKEQWDSITFPSEWIGAKGKFFHDTFAEMIRRKYHVRKINGVLHCYDQGVYVIGDKKIEHAMIKELSSISSNQRNEVLKYLEIVCEESEESHLNLFAFKNGIYDICKDELLEFNPNIVITNRIPWNYNADAPKSELVESILSGISCGNKEIRNLLEEVAGACLYRSCGLGGGKAVILLGDKHNGKSTYIHMLESMLGKENYSSLDLRNLSHRFETIMLYGKLANLGDDISHESITDTATFKKVTTGETIKAEEKGKPAFNFVPYATQIYSANQMPRTNDPTGAVLRRLLIVPMDAKFTPSTEGYDPMLKEKLNTPEHMEYFIQLALDGLSEVLNKKQFTVPEQVVKETEEYERENNPIMTFIDEVGENAIVNELTSKVYARYLRFCQMNGFTAESKISFSRRVNKMLGTNSKVSKIQGKSVKVFRKVTV